MNCDPDVTIIGGAAGPTAIDINGSPWGRLGLRLLAAAAGLGILYRIASDRHGRPTAKISRRR